MAEIEVGDLVARISFDDTGLNKSMAEINRQMKLVQSEFDKASSKIAGYGSEEEKLRAKSDLLTKQMQLQQQKINNLNAAFQKSVQEKGADAAATQRLATQLNKAQTEYNKMESQLNETTKEINEQQRHVSALGKAWNDSMDQARNSVGTLSDGLKQTGAAVTAAGGAIAVGLGAAVSKAADFEQGISNVKSVMDPEDVEKFGDELSGLAIKMGSETKYSATEAAKGIEELVKAGVSADAIMGGGLAGALNLATAGQLDLASAAEIASTALNAFKADNLNVARAADILAGAANASATDVGELKFGLSAVSAVAAGVGLSFEDTATALAAFAQNGLKGSDAGTSLKTMLMNLQPSTDAQIEEFDRLGLLTYDVQKGLKILADNGVKPAGQSFEQVDAALKKLAAQLSGSKEGSAKAQKEYTKLAMQTGVLTSEFFRQDGTIKSLAEITDVLQGSMKGMNDAQRLASMEILFGSDAIRAANILYKEGADGINRMNEAMNAVTAADVAAQRMDNLKGSIEQLKGSMETAMISIGNAFLPAIRTLTDTMGKLVGAFNNLSPGMQSFIAISAAVAAALALIAGPLLILIGMLPSIIAGFGVLAPIIASLGAVFAVLTGPIGLVIAAIAALTVAGITLTGNWGKVRDVTLQVWREIQAFIRPAVAAISGFIRETFGGLAVWWKQIWPDLKQAFENIWKAMYAVLKPIIGAIVAIMEWAWPYIKAIIVSTWENIKGVISGALNIITGIISAFAHLFTGNWTALWADIKKILSGALELLWNAVQLWGVGKFLKLFGKIGADVAQVFVKMGSEMLSILKGLIGKVTAWASDFSKPFIDIAKSAFNWGKYIVEGLWKGISSLSGWIKSKVNGFVEDIGSTIKDFFGIASPSKLMKEYGGNIVEGLAVGIDQNSKKAETAAKKAAAAAAKAIKENFNKAFKEAQYHFKMGEIDSVGYVSRLEKVKEEYAKTGEQIQKVNLAIKAANDKLAKDLAKAVKEQFDNSKSYIESRKQANELSLAQELALWEKVQARYVQGTKERTAADKEVNRIKQQMDQESYDKSKAFIENHKLSLMDELAAWERVQARYKAGSKEREDAEKNVMRVRQEVYDQLLAANEAFLSSTKQINDNVIAEEKRLNDEYDQAVNQRTSAITGFAGIFDQVSSDIKTTGEELLKNLQGQVSAIVSWQDNLAQLAQRGVNGGLLKELQDLGPKAAPELAALNTLTDQQLQEYVMLWQTKNNLARNQAIQELQGLKTDTVQKITELKTEAAAKLEEVRKTFEETVKKIRGGAAGEFNAMKADMPTIGKQAMQGLLNGLTSMQGPLVAKAQEIATAISNTIRKALAIRSPSRVMMEIGQFTGAGLALGMQNSLGAITRQAANMAAAALPVMSPAAAGGTSAYGGSYAPTPAPAAGYPSDLTITVPVNIDGKQVAVATAKPMEDRAILRGRARGVK